MVLTIDVFFRTPFKKSPKVNGKDIDLYLLYVVVTAHGGWIKVSRFVPIFYLAFFFSAEGQVFARCSLCTFRQCDLLAGVTSEKSGGIALSV